MSDSVKNIFGNAIADSVKNIFGNAIADLINEYTHDPINDEFEAFQLELEFEAADDVVKLYDFINQSFVRTQSREDEASARLWEEWHISPEDEEALLPLVDENTLATLLHAKHASDEAATAAYFARRVAQGVEQGDD